MKKSQHFIAAETPINPLPQHILHKRFPSRILSLGYKKNVPKNKGSIDIKNAPKINNHINRSEEKLAKSPNFPEIHIINNFNNAITRNPLRYFKVLPKFHKYKPLFHDRNKSYIRDNDEDEEYIAMKNNISLLDY